MSWADELVVYLIADFTGRPEQRVLVAVSAALDAGVRIVQYRDKTESPDEVRRDRAGALRSLTRPYGAVLVVNDDLRLAFAVGADGVHLGPRDMDPLEARRRAGSGFIIGGSAGTVERAVQLERMGVDYLGVGAIFDARGTKPDASLPRGPHVIEDIRRQVRIPIVAIGGIEPDNAARVFEAGAHGVAVARSVLDAPDPADAVARLMAAGRRFLRTQTGAKE